MQVRDTRDFTEGRWIEPTNQYPKDNIQDNQTIETNQSQSMKWRHDDLSRGSRACRHASPRYVPPTPRGSVANRYHTEPLKRRHKNLPNGEKFRYEKFTRVGIRRFAGEPQ
jgi:hypothetical protein